MIENGHARNLGKCLLRSWQRWRLIGSMLLNPYVSAWSRQAVTRTLATNRSVTCDNRNRFGGVLAATSLRTLSHDTSTRGELGAKVA